MITVMARVSHMAAMVQYWGMYFYFLLSKVYAAQLTSDMTPQQKLILSRNITNILNELVSTKHYDKRLRPNYGGPPVDVGVTIHVSSISAVSEVEMDFTLDFYLRQMWTDPRLAFSHMGVDLDALTVGIEYVRDIWVPDTFFPNEKKSFFHQATTHNSFLRISPTGQIKTSQRLTVTATCPMALQLFPLDSQECSLEIESYGYSTKDIKYTWYKGKESVSMGNVTLPQFIVAEFHISEIITQLSTGTYSRLVCSFLFTRSIGFYMIQIYLPSILIVIISWVSFWLSRDATPARVALGVTTVLTMTTLMTTTNAAMPKVSYIKSIDIYLGTCFLMVFASLLEYAAVGYLNKRMRMKRERAIRKQPQSTTTGPSTLNMFTGGGSSSPNPSNPRLPLLPLPSVRELQNMDVSHRGYRQLNTPQSPPLLNASNFQQVECDCDIEKGTIKAIKLTAPRKRHWGTSPSGIDKYSRIVFPLIFSAFNAVYWTVYMNIGKHKLVESD